jgi:SNF2 family DNA or RNA helicase
MTDRIVAGGSIVHLDFILLSCGNEAGVVSYFDRSLSSVKSFGAMLTLGNRFDTEERSVCTSGAYETFIQPVFFGKEKFYHALSIAKGCGTELFMYTKENRGRQFYDFLMKNFDLPLMAEWGETLFSYFYEKGDVSDGTKILRGAFSVTEEIPYREKMIPLRELELSIVGITDESLKEGVSELLQSGRIRITDEPQQKLQFTNMDEYFKEYGPSLVKNLEDTLSPLRPLDGEAHDFTLNTMRLYPQQLAQVNGDVALLENGKYAILNHGMGTGKTITAPSVVESFFVRKFLRTNPKATLEDAYKDPHAINYRNIIMCPGHLVQKWADEIKSQVPYAKVTVLSEFSQLVELRERGSKRAGKEYYVLSKDFCKLSYQSIPSPTKRRTGVVKKKTCADCGAEFVTPGKTCPNCGSTSVELSPKRYDTVTGMVCPHCNNVLIPYVAPTQAVSSDGIQGLDHTEFTGQNMKNSRCYYCDEELWQPFVANLGNKKAQKWMRATYYANKAHKGTKTVWAHKDYMPELNAHFGEMPIRVMEDRSGARKYAPAEFIKRYLKGYFDIAIFDEIQDLKGGFTGQGHAMHALIKASKKQLALTGTIAGGMASHLFYTLFRLEPKRMIERGFKYTDELAFSKAYGKVETTFEYSGSSDGEFLASCKGQQKTQPKVKPGISPLIFMDFLLDRTTFLDLSDMSKYLPKFKEQVISVPAEGAEEQEMFGEYRSVTNTLTQLSRKGEGMAVLSTMLQFSLSYLDKPYGREPIKSAINGTILAEPENFDEYAQTDDYGLLLSKEQKLISLIREEQSEGRNVVIYCEYTGEGSMCVTYRLKEIIEKYCNLKGKVEVLESSSPQASKREAWMRKKATQGTKVFITNPRCVATGLDFCFTVDGVAYNYPTLIFYQLGYSLFTTWQASRRAYRLNQTKECRTYYMAWSGSAQEAVISLIAEKQAATSAIQGKFSTEGLAAMANGVDSRMKLAQAMADMDSITGNGLQEMFDVLGADNGEDMSYSNYKPMLLYKELIGEEAAPEGDFDTVKTGQYSLMDLLGFNNRSAANEISADTKSDVPIVTTVTSTFVLKPVLTVAPANGKKKAHAVSGQLSLF